MNRLVSQKILLIPIPRGGGERSHPHARPTRGVSPSLLRRAVGLAREHFVSTLSTSPGTNLTGRYNQEGDPPAEASPCPLAAADRRSHRFETGDVGQVLFRKASGNGQDW